MSEMNEGMVAGPGDGDGRSPEAGKIFLDLGEKGGQEAAGRTSSGVTGHTIFLLVVLVLSAATILGMRHVGMGRALLANAIQINYKPGEHASDWSDEYRRVMADLDRSARPVQVEAADIDESPFHFAVAHTVIEEDGEVIVDTTDYDAIRRAEEAERQREARAREIETAFGSLRLQGILGGRVPVARISGKTVRVGDTLVELFRVTEITGEVVTLECDDQRYELTMERSGR